MIFIQDCSGKLRLGVETRRDLKLTFDVFEVCFDHCDIHSFGIITIIKEDRVVYGIIRNDDPSVLLSQCCSLFVGMIFFSV